MNVADVVRAQKTGVHVGARNSGHIPPGAFPLSLARRKAYKFGPEYKWRIVTFDCLQSSFRLLILLNENKQIFRATLALEAKNDSVVLCQYEFHASEPGWHCHVTFREVDSLPRGITRTHLRRWPSARTGPLKLDFGVREVNALGVAATRFRVVEPTPLGI